MRPARPEHIVLAIFLAVPLSVISLGWPAFVDWMMGPAPEPTPEVAGARETSTAQSEADSVPTRRPPTAGLPATIAPKAVSTQNAPTPTPQLTDTPEAPPSPTGTPAASTPAPTAARTPSAPDPSAAVRQFYDRVSKHDFANAAALWSPRMVALFAPQQNIDERFSQTHSISVKRADVVSQNGERAAVAVDVAESAADGQHHWTGAWQVVNGPNGWLLDEPELQGA